MAGGHRKSRFATGRRTQSARTLMEDLDMHPTVAYELAKIKIAEEQQYAARQRLAREAVREGPRAIDFGGLGERLRVRLFGGPAIGGRPAGAGA
jgi:hypothetical protein